MAITAWSAKVWRSVICLSVNGRTSLRPTSMTPMRRPSRSNGTARWSRTGVRRPSTQRRFGNCRDPPACRRCGRRVARGSPSRRRVAVRADGKRARSAASAIGAPREWPPAGASPSHEEDRADGPSHSRVALSSDGVKHRLHVGRRARDHAQDLGRRRLLLELVLRVLRERPFFSCSSVNSRTFSMAMTACAAKVSRSSICASVNGRTSVRRITMAPIGTP